MNCPIAKCHHNSNFCFRKKYAYLAGGVCLEGSCSQYDLYRSVTGKCETCGAEMDNHPKCGACGILCGTGHLEGLPSPYRGHGLCGHCVASWKRLDQLVGRETTWSEFLNPQPRIFSSVT